MPPTGKSRPKATVAAIAWAATILSMLAGGPKPKGPKPPELPSPLEYGLLLDEYPPSLPPPGGPNCALAKDATNSVSRDIVRCTSRALPMASKRLALSVLCVIV